MSSEKLKHQEIIPTIELPRRPIPLMASLTKVLQINGLNPLTLYNESYLCDPANQINAQSYLLSLACRQAGDQTGILGPLIGVSNGPEDTRQILKEIEQGLLAQLGDSKQKVFDALTTGEIADAETVLAIDQLLGQAVLQIRQVAVKRRVADPELDYMTPEAYNFRSINQSILKKLLRQRCADIFGLLQRSNVATLDDLLNISKTPIIPLIDASPLLAILPDEINRLENPQPPNIDEPLGFISRLNMAGSDLFRFFAGALREHLPRQQLQEKIASQP